MCLSVNLGMALNKHNENTQSFAITSVTRSHEMSLNYLKFGNMGYMHVSNLQVLLVVMILKSCFYSKNCGCDVFLKVALLRKLALNFSVCSE